MSRQHHELKTETQYYQAMENRVKAFEVRKNDRDFRVGDMVTLNETVNGIATGRRIGPKEIKYILLGGQFGIDKDYVVMNF